ncbi:rhodanese-like domain-containing protein [Streptomyces sp. NBC_01216]|uniref:rhodanese-like domain-containing protein n=1 Tax=unclassified Streptomyces TaxID=2593676 RepID=UPI002E0F4A97|nr:rhodanese-like domain-containing protein [Streptomyces sp. NBC_01216]
MTSPTTATTLTTSQATNRFGEYVVIDVRTPGEYAAGHVPGARNIPLDRIEEAAAALRAAAERQPLLIVCASGARSSRGCGRLAALGVQAASLDGGTAAWVAAGHPVERPAGVRAAWPMDRQVRLAAGTLVLLGFLAGLAWPPAHWLSGLVAAGLVFSAVTGTCGMAALLGRLPHNRAPRGAVTFRETLEGLTA